MESNSVIFTVQLKNKDTVQVPIEELENFLEKNRDQIQVQQKKMGKRRAAPVSSSQ